MDDLFAKLNELLSGEEGQKQLAALSESLSGALSDNRESEPEQPASPLVPEGLNMDMMLKLGQVMQKLNSREGSDNARLIEALKPYLKSEHQKRADEAVRILKLLEILPALKDGDLF